MFPTIGTCVIIGVHSISKIEKIFRRLYLQKVDLSEVSTKHAFVCHCLSYWSWLSQGFSVLFDVLCCLCLNGRQEPPNFFPNIFENKWSKNQIALISTEGVAIHCVITNQTKYSEPFLDVFSCVWHFCLHDRQLRVSRSRYLSQTSWLCFLPF